MNLAGEFALGISFEKESAETSSVDVAPCRTKLALRTKLLDGEPDLFPGSASEIRSPVGEVASYPAAADAGERDAAIEGIELDPHRSARDVPGAELVIPVTEIVDRDTADRIDPARRERGRPRKENPKRIIDGDETRNTLAGPANATVEDLPRGGAESRMAQRGIHHEQPTLGQGVDTLERPDRVALRTMRGRQSAAQLCELRIPVQLMNPTRIVATEQPLEHGAETRLGDRALLLVRVQVRQSRLEIDRAELRPAIDGDGVRNTVVATHTVEDHLEQARPTRGIEREREGERQTRLVVDENRQPRFAENRTGVARDELNIQRRVINMTKLENPIGMRRKSTVRSGQRALKLVSGTGALALTSQSDETATLDRTPKGFPASPENSWRVPIPVQTQEPPCGTSAVLTITCATTEALA